MTTLAKQLKGLRKGDGLACQNGRVFDFCGIDESALEDGTKYIWSVHNVHGPWNLNGSHSFQRQLDIVRVIKRKEKKAKVDKDVAWLLKFAKDIDLGVSPKSDARRIRRIAKRLEGGK